MPVRASLKELKLISVASILNLWSVFLSASLNIIARLYGSSPDAQPQLHIRIVSVSLITSSKLGITFCIKNCQTCLSRKNFVTLIDRESYREPISLGLEFRKFTYSELLLIFNIFILTWILLARNVGLKYDKSNPWFFRTDCLICCR